MGIEERIKALEAKPESRDMPEFFRKSYIFMMEADYRTDGSAERGVDINEYAKSYAKINGTMEAFVMERRTEQ